MIPSIYRFEENELRITKDENGNNMLVAVDVAKALGYKDPVSAVRKHCKGRAIRPIPTVSGEQMMICIREPDLYRLIARSKLPSAQEFERWIFEEVLPSIRKTGAYLNPGMTADQFQAVMKQIADMAAMKKQLEMERDGWQNLAIQQGEVAQSWMAMCQHGELSERNGLPRMLKRRGTFVADPRGHNSAEMNQLQLTFKLI